MAWKIIHLLYGVHNIQTIKLVNENLTFSPTDKLTPMVLISGR